MTTARERELPTASIVRALARAYHYRRMLESGRYATLKEIAVAEGVNQSYLSRVIRLTLLAPDIVETLLDGRAGHHDLGRLMGLLTASWSKQRDALVGD